MELAYSAALQCGSGQAARHGPRGKKSVALGGQSGRCLGCGPEVVGAARTLGRPRFVRSATTQSGPPTSRRLGARPPQSGPSRRAGDPGPPRWALPEEWRVNQRGRGARSACRAGADGGGVALWDMLEGPRLLWESLIQIFTPRTFTESLCAVLGARL